MVKVRPFIAVALAGVSVISLSACSSSSRKEDLAYVEKPVEQLYADAALSLDRRQWDNAALQFNEVQRQHPYSEWAQRAQLMSAFAQYKDRSYEQAISSAQSYISLYPGGENAVYAYYLIAICHFEQIIDVGREQGRTEMARSALREVVRRYPSSEYARDAELKLDMVNDQLAGKEMVVGRFYLENDKFLAAINRFKNVLDKYETTGHTPEALHRMVEAYVSLGLFGEAQRTAAVLGYNYPDSEWYKDTYTLLDRQGILPKQEVSVTQIK